MCNGSARGTCPPNIVDNMGGKILPVGIERFEDVVERAVYVDKTLLIQDLLDGVPGGTTLFCRPRRFGKSLALRMLQRFFETPIEGYIADYSGLFKNLAIWSAGKRYQLEQGAHPVIFLTLGAVQGETWEEARDVLALVVAAEYARHRYLLEGSALADFEKAMFERIAGGVASLAELKRSLAWLATLLHRCHGAKTVILIDEYDRPITDGYINGFRDEATRFMRAWLTDVLKATSDLHLACVTGVQRVSKESIFSDLNNLTVDTPLDANHAESFGFTEAEAEALATHARDVALKQTVEKRYGVGLSGSGCRLWGVSFSGKQVAVAMCAG